MKKLLLLLILTYTLTASTIKELQQEMLSAPTLAERFILTSTLAQSYNQRPRPEGTEYDVDINFL